MSDETMEKSGLNGMIKEFRLEMKKYENTNAELYDWNFAKWLTCNYIKRWLEARRDKLKKCQHLTPSDVARIDEITEILEGEGE